MVAIHNRKLTAPDIFPDNIWTERQALDYKSRIEADLIDQGKSKVEAYFEASELLRRRLNDQPRLRERQLVMGKIYKLPKVYSFGLSENEIAWLVDRIQGVNDPIGVDVLAKLKHSLKSTDAL